MSTTTKPLPHNDCDKGRSCLGSSTKMVPVGGGVASTGSIPALNHFQAVLWFTPSWRARSESFMGIQYHKEGYNTIDG